MGSSDCQVDTLAKKASIRRDVTLLKLNTTNRENQSVRVAGFLPHLLVYWLTSSMMCYLLC